MGCRIGHPLRRHGTATHQHGSPFKLATAKFKRDHPAWKEASTCFFRRAQLVPRSRSAKSFNEFCASGRLLEATDMKPLAVVIQRVAS